MNSSTNIPRGQKKNWLPMALIACTAIAAGIFIGSGQIGKNSGSPEHQALQDLQSSLINSTVFPDDFKKVPAFSLLQGENQPLTEATLAGQWSVLFFGFTNCPDVCPVTLNELNAVVAQLSEDGATVPQVLFITVDPVRDTVEKMTEYVTYFNPEFIGGSGELTDITALTTKLGIVASYTAATDGSNDYSVDHTASLLLIDPDLRVRAKLNAPHKADTLTADLKALISHYN